MGQVVSIDSARPEPPTTIGPCVCLGCRHAWEGEVPVGTDALECPACRTMKGVREGLVCTDSDAMACVFCDNLFLTITPSTMDAHCPNCGHWCPILE